MDIGTKVLREKAEALIVISLQEKLKKKEITGDRAKEIATKVLLLIPEQISSEDLKKNVSVIGQQMPELRQVTEIILRDQDKQFISESLPKVRDLLQKLEFKAK